MREGARSLLPPPFLWLILKNRPVYALPFEHVTFAAYRCLRLPAPQGQAAVGARRGRAVRRRCRSHRTPCISQLLFRALKPLADIAAKLETMKLFYKVLLNILTILAVFVFVWWQMSNTKV